MLTGGSASNKNHNSRKERTLLVLNLPFPRFAYPACDRFGHSCWQLQEIALQGSLIAIDSPLKVDFSRQTAESGADSVVLAAHRPRIGACLRTPCRLPCCSRRVRVSHFVFRCIVIGGKALRALRGEIG